MAWYYQDKLMRAGRVWTDSEGRKYPPQWYGRSTDAEKEAKGWTWVDDPAPFDNRFYWSAGVPKALDDVNEVDAETGEPILDADGNQVVTKGLKSQAIAQTKTTAGGLLAPTDWYVVREAETQVPVPDSVTYYRSAVRNASGDIEAAINACTTLEAFMALYDTPVDDEGMPTGNAPINDWPEEM